MKSTQIIVNRIENWFDINDLQNDNAVLAISILEKLSSRLQQGLDYDVLKLSVKMSDNISFDLIKTIDKALVILISRRLVELKSNVKNRKIFITRDGLDLVKEYRNEVKLSVH